MKDLIFWIVYQVSKNFSVGGVPILVYHSISDKNWKHAVKPQEFEKQIRWLSQHYSCVSTREVMNWVKGKKALPPDAIAITFDDGYIDNLTTALPIMDKYGFKGTVFVTANLKSGSGTLGNSYQLMSRSDLKTLIRAGWEIQSHGYSHLKLTRIDSRKLETELKQSRQVIGKMIGKKVDMLAYPGGAANERVKQLSMKYYQAGWSIIPGFVRQGDDLYQLTRIEVKRDISLIAFKAHLTSIVEWVQKLKGDER